MTEQQSGCGSHKRPAPGVHRRGGDACASKSSLEPTLPNPPPTTETSLLAAVLPPKKSSEGTANADWRGQPPRDEPRSRPGATRQVQAQTQTPGNPETVLHFRGPAHTRHSPFFFWVSAPQSPKPSRSRSSLSLTLSTSHGRVVAATTENWREAGERFVESVLSDGLSVGAGERMTVDATLQCLLLSPFFLLFFFFWFAKRTCGVVTSRIRRLPARRTDRPCPASASAGPRSRTQWHRNLAFLCVLLTAGGFLCAERHGTSHPRRTDNCSSR